MIENLTHTPLQTILSLGFLAFVLMSSYGWGAWLFGRIGFRPEKEAVAAVAGLGVMIFLGGMLNLLRISYGFAVDGLLLIGLVLALRPMGRCRWWNQQRNAGEWAIIASQGVFIALVMGVVANLQIAPSVFNLHDDFEKYFAHPVRMLQTGTVFGSPLSAVGSETLGGQAFLHAMVLNHFPLPYVNGMDAVAGLLLCLLLAVSGTSNVKALIVSLISFSMIVFINPQYVNVSALYLAVAFMMSAFVGGHTNTYSKIPASDLPPPLLLGLIYATLISFKPYYLMFSLVHGGMCAAALIAAGKPLRHSSRWVLQTTGFALLFVSPWLVLHLPRYLSGSVHNTTRFMPYLNSVPPFLSWHPLDYGNSFGHYTCVGLLVIFWGALIAWRKRQTAVETSSPWFDAVVAAAATVVCTYALMVILGPWLNGYATNLRYAIPFLMAGAPVVFTVCANTLENDRSTAGRSLFAGVLLLGLLIPITFSSSLMVRFTQGYRLGSVLAFSKLATRSDYITYNESVLNGAARQRVETVQELVPASASLVAWISTPFYLDYSRNVIYDADPAGIANPWAHIPPATAYIMMEYRGYAVRTLDQYMNSMRYGGRRRERHIAQKCLVFLGNVSQLRKNAQVIYDDGGIVLFKTLRSET